MKLLLALFFCHWLADYTWLSRPDMLAAKRFGKPFGPILMHGLIHATLMFAVLLLFGVEQIRAVELYIFQTWTHAGIDTAKGMLNQHFVVLQNPQNVLHWCVFGLDQYAHCVVILLMWHYSGLAV
ncbi:DUF3307 domain-containing protein [Hymenobacter aerilatus]|uniref:DUF3307 domain-containing protein n=1 Tax=Hymenobacter aerilatus TaxID=2932251 RepID=A0A8T9T137_9BACT|nr:DUF3307 domain-containing protein [Hymenobacter aerilatus]UOR06250.1 DUF3307 domain-containing protein [Hymenobacter aerilatus]